MIRVNIIGITTRRNLHENLEPFEKETVDKWLADKVEPHPDHPVGNEQRYHHGHTYTDHVFKDAAPKNDPHRIRIPFVDHGDNVESHVRNEVEAHLNRHGYHVVDYKKGLATKIGSKQQDKIHNLLQDGPPYDTYLSSAFKDDEARLDRRKDYTKDHVITITRHPHDVAGMSACSYPWSSCMNFKSGSENQHLPLEVKEGTMVAYLHHKDDKNIEHPVSRLAIRPWEKAHFDWDEDPDTAHRVYRAEAPMGVYGKKSAGNFHKIVTDWANKNFVAKPNTVYSRQADTYPEHPGPRGDHRHGEITNIDALNARELRAYVIYYGKWSGTNVAMPKHHYDYIMNNKDDHNVASLIEPTGVEHRDNHMRNLGTLAKKHPHLYFDSGVFGKSSKASHGYTAPDHDGFGRSHVNTGHDIITKLPGSHARAVFPNIDDHIHTISKSVGENAGAAHEKLLHLLDSANKKSVIAQHRDTIHRGVLHRPVIGDRHDEHVYKHIDNLSTAFSNWSGMSNAMYNSAMEHARKSIDTFKPGKKTSNWVHHTMNINSKGPNTVSYDSPANQAARYLVSKIEDNYHYEPRKHADIVAKLRGKSQEY